MAKFLIRAGWLLTLLALLCWLIILLKPGSPIAAWLSTRLIIAQALAFPALLTLAGLGILLLALPISLYPKASWPTRLLAGLTALACLATSSLALTDPYCAGRRQNQGIPLIACHPYQQYRVTTYNAQNSLTAQSLEKLLVNRPDFLVLPEVSADNPALQKALNRYQLFSSQSQEEGIAPTLVLVSRHLGRYQAQEVAITFGGLILAPEEEGSGPTLLAVHTAPPLPSYMDRWRQDLDTLEKLAHNPRLDLIAGDFNATLHHGSLATYAGENSRTGLDAALSLNRIYGTWPADGFLGLRAPIDHILVMQGPPARAHSLNYLKLGASDHLALAGSIGLCPSRSQSLLP